MPRRHSPLWPNPKTLPPYGRVEVNPHYLIPPDAAWVGSTIDVRHGYTLTPAGGLTPTNLLFDSAGTKGATKTLPTYLRGTGITMAVGLTVMAAPTSYQTVCGARYVYPIAAPYNSYLIAVGNESPPKWQISYSTTGPTQINTVSTVAPVVGEYVVLSMFVAPTYQRLYRNGKQIASVARACTLDYSASAFFQLAEGPFRIDWVYVWNNATLIGAPDAQVDQFHAQIASDPYAFLRVRHTRHYGLLAAPSLPMSQSVSGSASSSMSASSSQSPSTSRSLSSSLSASRSESLSPSPSSSPSRSASSSQSPSETPSSSQSQSVSPSVSASPSLSESLSASPSYSGSASLSHSISSSTSHSPSLWPPEIRLIRRLRQSPHVSDEQIWQYVSFFHLDVQTGQGTPLGQGLDPQIVLQYSNDSGHTWSQEMRVSAGVQGQYAWRAIWRRLGKSRKRTWRVVMTDPVRWSLLAAFVGMEKGTS